MALSKIGPGVAYDNSGIAWSTANLTKDTGTAIGDLAIVAVSYYENGLPPPDPPGGFTARASVALSGTYDSGTASSLRVFTRVIDGSEGGTFDVNFVSGTTFATAMLLTLRGTSALSFASVAAGTAANGTSIAAPSVTSASGQGLVAIYGLGDPGGTYTAPGGMTLGIAPSPDSTNTGRLYFETPSAGESGTRTLSFTNTRDAIGLSMLVNGAAAGGGLNIAAKMHFYRMMRRN